MKTTKNKCISTQRGIACILIVLIHSRFPGLFGQILVAIARSAVFYFFVVSGYFSYDENNERFFYRNKKQFKKVLFITCCAFSLGIIWRILFAVLGSSGSISGLFSEWSNAAYVLTFLVWQNDIVLGPYWFLLSLLVCYPTICIVKKIKIAKLYLPIVISLVTVNFFLCVVCSNIPIYFYRNFILTGFPFFLLGYYIRINQKNGIIQTNINGIVLVFIGLLLTLIEFFLVGSKLIYIGSILIVLGSIFYAINYPNKELKALSILGDKYSLYIYIFHWYVIDISNIITKRLGVRIVSVIKYLMPFIVLIVTIILSFFIKVALNYCKSNKRNSLKDL